MLQKQSDGIYAIRRAERGQQMQSEMHECVTKARCGGQKQKWQWSTKIKARYQLEHTTCGKTNRSECGRATAQRHRTNKPVAGMSKSSSTRCSERSKRVPVVYQSAHNSGCAYNGNGTVHGVETNTLQDSGIELITKWSERIIHQPHCIRVR